MNYYVFCRRVVVAEHSTVIDHWRVTQDVDFRKMSDMPVVEQNAVIIYYESGGAVSQLCGIYWRSCGYSFKY